MPKTFEIKDADGVSHTYTTNLHRTHDGAQLAAWVTGHAVEAVLSAAGDAGIAAVEKVAAKKLKGWAAFSAIVGDPEVMKAVNMGKVGGALRGVLLKLTLPMQMNLLRLTNRDSKPLVKDGQPTGTYNDEYPANYAELAQALYKVCEVNGFFPALGGLVDAAKVALAAMPSTTESDD